MFIVKMLIGKRPAIYIGPFETDHEAQRYAEVLSRAHPQACVKAIRLLSQFELVAAA
jgi:hypothetical protein